MIKILTGVTNPGGSTVAFINLVKAFNKHGHRAILLGPHDYHLTQTDYAVKCEVYNEDLFTETDSVIVHHIKGINKRPNVKSFILSSHEQEVFPLNLINLTPFDKIHFVSKHQQEWHNVDYPYFINGNVYDDLINRNPTVVKTGGVVGTIWPPKCTMESVEAALQDGCEKVLLYGEIPGSCNEYFEEILKLGNVEYMGFVDDKQAMYDYFTDLYLYSKRECLPSVVAEATLAGKKIHIPNDRNYKSAEYIMDTETVVNNWLREFEIRS